MITIGFYSVFLDGMVTPLVGDDDDDPSVYLKDCLTLCDGNDGNDRSL